MVQIISLKYMEFRIEAVHDVWYFGDGFRFVQFRVGGSAGC